MNNYAYFPREVKFSLDFGYLEFITLSLTGE